MDRSEGPFVISGNPSAEAFLEPIAEHTTPRILIVDDEILTAHSIETAVQSRGWEVVGPVDQMEVALTAAGEEEIHAAILDLNVEGRLVWPVAAILKGRGVPFLFLTGYHESQVVHPDYEDAPTLGKPYIERELLAHIARLLNDAGGPPAGDSPVQPLEGD
jgi:DNA-binding response OmpR family regulator